MIRKITSDPQNVTVRDVIEDYNEKMAIVKDFQRRQVWKKQTINEYIESVSEGIAVSGVIVADINSGIEASEACGDYERSVMKNLKMKKSLRLTKMDKTD